MLKTGTKVLDGVKDARGIAFLDVDEDVSVLVLFLSFSPVTLVYS